MANMIGVPKNCQGCTSWSTKLKRCLKGKAAPKTLDDARTTGLLLGANYICSKAPYYTEYYNEMIKEN